MALCFSPTYKESLMGNQINAMTHRWLSVIDWLIKNNEGSSIGRDQGFCDDSTKV